MDRGVVVGGRWTVVGGVCGDAEKELQRRFKFTIKSNGIIKTQGTGSGGTFNFVVVLMGVSS